MTTTSINPRRAGRWFADAYFGPVPIAAAALLAVAALAYAWPLFRGHTPYGDVVVGMVGWNDGDKPADVYALLTLAVAGTAAAVGFGRAFRAIAPDGPASPLGRALNGLLLVALAPAAWRLCVAAVQPAQVIPPVRLLAAFPLGVLAMAIGLRRFPRGSVTPEHVLACGGAALLSAAFAGFAAAALGVAYVRLEATAGAVSFVSGLIGSTVAVFVGVAVAGVVACWATSATVEQFRRRLLRGLVLWQVPLPLLLFYLLPPPLVDYLGRFAPVRPTLLIGVLWACVAASMLATGRRLWRPAGTLVGAVAVPTVIALLVYCDCPCDGGPPTAPRDLFHWGEQALPWQQLWQWHRRPYVDFAPVHALMAYLRGGMNQLFFGGVAATYGAADALLDGLAAAATAAAAAWLLGPLAALVLIAFPLPELDRLLLLAPALYVTAAPRTWRRPARGLVAWVAVAVVTAAYNPSVGMAFAVGSTPVALWLAAPAGWRRLAIVFVGVAVVAAVAMAVGPVRQTVLGYVDFIRVNAATNTTANDIPWVEGAWMRHDFAGLGSTQVLWETARFAWVLVAVVAAGLAWWAAARPAGQRPPGVVPLAVGVVLVLCLASPWTDGRIDIGAVSRPGAVSRMAVFLLLPPLLLLAAPTARTVLVIAVVGGLAYPSTATSVDPQLVLAKAVSFRAVPPTARVIDGPSIGLPNVGQVVEPEPDWIDEVAALHRDLQRVLRPGETFLDLTDEQALYFYMGMPAPVRYDSYVAASSAMQLAEERQLAERPVPVVLVGPAVRLDHAPASLRCYRLYRDYAIRFVPVVSGPFTLLVDPARAAPFPTTRPATRPGQRRSGFRPATTRPASRPATPFTPAELRLLLLDEAFHPDDLHRLPVAWGRSWPALQHRFTVVATTTESRGVPGKQWAADVPVPAAVTSGAAADFVLITVKLATVNPTDTRFAERQEPRGGSAEPDLSLRWSDAADHWVPDAAAFKGHTGQLLVPLGSYPRWLLCDHPRALRLAVADPRVMRSWEVVSVAFLRLTDADDRR